MTGLKRLLAKSEDRSEPDRSTKVIKRDHFAGEPIDTWDSIRLRPQVNTR